MHACTYAQREETQGPELPCDSDETAEHWFRKERQEKIHNTSEVKSMIQNKGLFASGRDCSSKAWNFPFDMKDYLSKEGIKKPLSSEWFSMIVVFKNVGLLYTKQRKTHSQFKQSSETISISAMGKPLFLFKKKRALHGEKHSWQKFFDLGGNGHRNARQAESKNIRRPEESRRHSFLSVGLLWKS